MITIAQFLEIAEVLGSFGSDNGGGNSSLGCKKNCSLLDAVWINVAQLKSYKYPWLDELNEETIETWDELRTAFISRFFPPALFDRLLGEIRAFSQHENESLTDAWLRMKEMLQNCHGHNLSKGSIIKIFYHGLSEITQEVLNAAVGGIFLYKTPNQAYQLLEDKVLLKLD
ncbi:reverse transcriptase domain-containing protein [Tanacetum coccineum]